MVSSPLPVGRCAYEDVAFAGGVETDDGAFPKTAAEANGPGYLRGADAADFTVAGNADAHILVVAPAVCLLFPQTLVVHMLQGHVKVAGVVPTVVVQAHRHVVTVFELRNQVAATDLHRVKAQLGGQYVHQPLQQEGGFRSSAAAVSFHRGRVGEAP